VLAAGKPAGRLHGIPLAHKDMYYQAGLPCTCGSAIRRDFVPDITCTVVERLSAAGAYSFAGLNMAEFAQNPTGHNRAFGDCHNPWNPPYITGGSSSGSGACVASGVTYASLGSDTGGSIRLPASACGVTGIKPTQTRVSRYGVMPLSFSADNVGPLARSARDCARILSVIAGADPKDPTSARTRARLRGRADRRSARRAHRRSHQRLHHHRRAARARRAGSGPEGPGGPRRRHRAP
jgi:aspartyl-tRNA(Asn)/glutamyl-tRNA(Gln) amidotransferase subunit A